MARRISFMRRIGTLGGIRIDWQTMAMMRPIVASLPWDKQNLMPRGPTHR
jgi:hypothetical protein